MFFRIALLVLTMSGALNACTDGSVGYPTPPDAGLDPNFSHSVGFSSIGQEPY
jgi:hypothetical protein